MPIVLSPPHQRGCKTHGQEDYSAEAALSMPFRLISWEITDYPIRDFTLPPTTRKLGCSESSSPLSEALCWIKRPSKRECGPPGPDFLSGVTKKHPQLVSLEA